MNSRQIALTAVFAALYTGVGYALHPFAFVGLQLRACDALYPLMAIFGLPSLIGLVTGHFLLNVSSPLGPIDLLSVLLFVPAKVAIWKWGLKAVPLHVLSVALWVPAMICLNGAPWLIYGTLFVTVGIGEIIAEILLGVPLAVAIKKRVGKNTESISSHKGA